MGYTVLLFTAVLVSNVTSDSTKNRKTQIIVLTTFKKTSLCSKGTWRRSIWRLQKHKQIHTSQSSNWASTRLEVLPRNVLHCEPAFFYSLNRHLSHSEPIDSAWKICALSTTVLFLLSAWISATCRTSRQMQQIQYNGSRIWLASHGKRHVPYLNDCQDCTQNWFCLDIHSTSSYSQPLSCITWTPWKFLEPVQRRITASNTPASTLTLFKSSSEPFLGCKAIGHTVHPFSENPGSHQMGYPPTYSTEDGPKLIAMLFETVCSLLAVCIRLQLRTIQNHRMCKDMIWLVSHSLPVIKPTPTWLGHLPTGTDALLQLTDTRIYLYYIFKPNFDAQALKCRRLKTWQLLRRTGTPSYIQVHSENFSHISWQWNLYQLTNLSM